MEQPEKKPTVVQGEIPFPKEEPEKKVISVLTDEEKEQVYKDDPENPEEYYQKY